MSETIILIICFLLLVSYLFEITSSKTRIPSVVILLFLGWATKQFITFFNINIPELSPILPVLGTIGLILIVLEGALELEINKDKLELIIKSFLGALLTILVLVFLFAYLLSFFGDFSLKDRLINVIPFCLISSAIAIPSVKNLSPNKREFVIYESSFSDILGVLIFYFLAFNEIIYILSFGSFILKIIIMIIFSFIATFFLSFLLRKIDHHIKYIPIILLVILFYAISKIYYLPGLIFILILGLFLGNLEVLKEIKWFERFKLDQLEHEVKKFKELTYEATFLIRSLFFLLFGFLIETSKVLDFETISIALVIIFLIFFFRALQLKLSKVPLIPLLFVAPRGLITILLFLYIQPSQRIPIVSESLITQVIVLSTLIMMFALMQKKS